MEEYHSHARKLAQQYLVAGKPTEWFEVLYSQAKNGEASIPWADLKPNPNLTAWLADKQTDGTGKTALKIGCGLGDDVEELVDWGFRVVGFDISTSAIAWCKRRFPDSLAEYVVADLFYPPNRWHFAFDFVLESYTLQVLPPNLRAIAGRHIANFLAPGGTLLVVARARDPEDAPGQMPWPVTRAEMMQFVDLGLSLDRLEDYWDAELPSVRRFRGEFSRQNT